MKEKKSSEYYLIAFPSTILMMVCFLRMLFCFVFDLLLVWTEELSRYVFIVLIYCSVNAAVLDNARVKAELIDNVLSKCGRFALDITVKLPCAVVSLVITYNSRQTIYNASLSKQPSVSLGIPMAGLYALVAVMFCLIAFRFPQAVSKMIVWKREVETKSRIYFR